MRNILSLLFLVAEYFFRLKVIELNYGSGFGLDYPAKRGSVGKYLESSQTGKGIIRVYGDKHIRAYQFDGHPRSLQRDVRLDTVTNNRQVPFSTLPPLFWCLCRASMMHCMAFSKCAWIPRSGKPHSRAIQDRHNFCALSKTSRHCEGQKFRLLGSLLLEWPFREWHLALGFSSSSSVKVPERLPPTPVATDTSRLF